MCRLLRVFEFDEGIAFLAHEFLRILLPELLIREAHNGEHHLAQQWLQMWLHHLFEQPVTTCSWLC